MSASDLFTFGEVMALFVATDTDSVVTAREYALQVVGAEANVAVAVSRLGLKSVLMSRVGRDQLGDVVIDELRNEGVDVSRITRVANSTGSMVRNGGTIQPVEISYLRTLSAASTMSPSDLMESDISQTRWVHATGISMAISSTARETVNEALRLARIAKVKISFDLNIRRKLWSEDQAREALRETVHEMDVLFGGADEYQVLWGMQSPEENLARAAEVGVKTAILTAGAGTIRVLSGGIYWEIQPPIVEAVDPVGSGDAFVGATIAGLLSGMDMRDAIVQGSQSGAKVATQIGDWAGLPRGIGGVAGD